MELHRVRLFLLLALLVVGFTLFNEWQREHPPLTTKSDNSPLLQNTATDAIPGEMALGGGEKEEALPGATSSPSQWIEVITDVLKLNIDPIGGDIVRAELLKYPESLGSEKGVVLLDNTKEKYYVAQTGLVGKDQKGPDSHQHGRARYHTLQSQYVLNGDQLAVDLTWEEGGIRVVKSYLFERGSYLISVRYRLINSTSNSWNGHFYGQIRREFAQKSNGLLGVQMYQGAAVYTPDKPFKKISTADMKKKTFQQQIEGGWAAMLERYFLCAWVSPKNTVNNYYTRVDDQKVFNIGELTPVSVAPNGEANLEGQFFVGPEVADILKQIAPGLNLTIDYGILWPISQLLFWLLKNIQSFVGNWGVAIILVTVFIKLLFYKLSASSYRSMGQLRQLQPRIELLKQRHGDDKQQFSMAIMELYRKEKINPLGGCLPILIQIPVFIALYYVLLESIELRQAPFIGWIKDLSSRDPFYVLPLIMGTTMFLQQKMNPAPPDPMQAKIMMLMPLIFTVLFLSFPAGLVLYWTVNNLLSIAQQWYITRNLMKEGLAPSKTA